VATATDTVSGALAPVCSPAPGSMFPIGNATVTCQATDGAGNPGSGTFTVTVWDTNGGQPGLDGGASPTGTATETATTATDSYGAAMTATDVHSWRNIQNFIGNGSQSGLSIDDSNHIWTITGHNSGNLDGLAFTDTATITGGAGNDVFVIQSGGYLDSPIDGGAGYNTLDLSGKDR